MRRQRRRSGVEHERKLCGATTQRCCYSLLPVPVVTFALGFAIVAVAVTVIVAVIAAAAVTLMIVVLAVAVAAYCGRTREATVQLCPLL